jgi:hypothetical protein
MITSMGWIGNAARDLGARWMSDEDPPGAPDLSGEPASQDLQQPALKPPSDDATPVLLRFEGEEALARYREFFDHLYRSRAIFDPQGRVIIFDETSCDHVCFHDDRFDKRRKLHEREEKVRDHWDQERAEHIPWIEPALTTPTFIVQNNQVRGNLSYLLGYPRNNQIRPAKRYYVSVRPMNDRGTRVKFKTAYPITQRQWDDALRAPPWVKPRDHILYRAKTQRW